MIERSSVVASAIIRGSQTEAQCKAMHRSADHNDLWPLQLSEAHKQKHNARQCTEVLITMTDSAVKMCSKAATLLSRSVAGKCMPPNAHATNRAGHLLQLTARLKQ